MARIWLECARYAEPVNLPNSITIGRVALVPVFLFLSYGDANGYAVAAFIVFAVASLSDFVDGRLARSRGLESRLGAFLDPTADKLLVGAALLVLVDTRGFPLWAALLIAFREVAVQILRTQIAGAGGSLPASTAGKWKTTLQIAMVSWWLLPWEVNAGHWILMGLTLVATLVSGVAYFRSMPRKGTGPQQSTDLPELKGTAT